MGPSPQTWQHLRPGQGVDRSYMGASPQSPAAVGRTGLQCKVLLALAALAAKIRRGFGVTANQLQ